MEPDEDENEDENDSLMFPIWDDTKLEWIGISVICQNLRRMEVIIALKDSSLASRYMCTVSCLVASSMGDSHLTQLHLLYE